MSNVTLKLRGLEKSFGQNHVLKGIDLELRSGEVTALMGANGAGKSTLVKVLCGYHFADAGAIELAGTAFAPTDAADAIAKGVVTVHQSIDDGVIPDLDVATNLTLDRLTEPGVGFFVNDGKLRRQAREVAESMGLTMDVRMRVADLDVADRQMIAIARAMARSPKLLILDEPTSSLSSSEAERLFALIDRLRDEGVAILYISHRMSDIRRVADRIVSMRDGAVSGLFETEPLDYVGAVNAMLGHQMTEVDIDPVPGGEAVLRVENLKLFEDSKHISFEAREGEVVAFTGLLGSGKTRLVAHVPSRGLIGYHGEFLTDTRGTGVLNRVFQGWSAYKGPIPGRRAGVLISMENGQSVAYALWNLEERGRMFIGPQANVYTGMIIGEHSRDNDLEVNPLKGKKLTNVRASGSDDAVRLTPHVQFSLEEAIAYIDDDELVEVTPNASRLRKRFLDPHERKRMARAS